MSLIYVANFMVLIIRFFCSVVSDNICVIFFNKFRSEQNVSKNRKSDEKYLKDPADVRLLNSEKGCKTQKRLTTNML